MIALGVRYLTGYAVATNLSRQMAEWPPHPGRVFMALAAAYFESGGGSVERAALEWLEAAGAPGLYASGAHERSTVRAYVPVNDGHGGIEKRPRQDRAFPRVRPHEDCVYLVWEAEPAPEVREALAQLCAKVTRVGHSMSAVQMWLVERGEEPEPNWTPEAMGEMRIRVASRGTLGMLEAAFNGEAIVEYDELAERLGAAKGKEKARLKKEIEARFPGGRPESRRPHLAEWQGYKLKNNGHGEEEVVDGPFDEALVVLGKLDGPVLGLESTQQLTAALRNTAMKAAGRYVPEWLSGHDAAGAPSLRPHVAFFPLAHVGAEYADGHVMGLAMAVPREMVADGVTRDEELRRVLGPLFFDAATGEERQIELWNGEVWRWFLEREKRERPPVALRRETWTRPSRRWASVTPVVLHHHPKREGHVEEILRQAFVSALLPEPAEIRVTPVSELEGVGHAKSMPPFVQGGANLCRYQTHVTVWFEKKMRGPVLVGRGRFRGYGLFRPVDDGGARR